MSHKVQLDNVPLRHHQIQADDSFLQCNCKCKCSFFSPTLKEVLGLSDRMTEIFCQLKLAYLWFLLKF